MYLQCESRIRKKMDDIQKMTKIAKRLEEQAEMADTPDDDHQNDD
jgi:hypothetical protein